MSEISTQPAVDRTAERPSGGAVFHDESKLDRHRAEIENGIRNFLIYQRCPGYRWPYWVASSLDRESASFAPVSVPLLINDRHRDWIQSSNLLSPEAVSIDRRGMMSVSYDRWSVETWVLRGAEILRPQESGMVSQKRDPRTTVAGTTWKDGDFELRFHVYGNKTSIDENLVEIEINLKKAVENCSLLVAVRPYGNLRLGGVDRIEYRKESRLIRINGIDRLHLAASPDFILTGNARAGDCDPRGPSSGAMKVSCPDGMATLAVGFNLKKGESRHTLRLGLSGHKPIQPVKIDAGRIAENFTAFAAMRTDRGFKLSFPDREVQKWVYGAKGALLHYLHRQVGQGGPLPAAEMEDMFFRLHGCNRMGYFSESERLMVPLMERFQQDAGGSFEKIIAAGYFIICFADYFIHCRELDYLQKHFPRLKAAAGGMFDYCRKVKSLETLTKDGTNSIENNFIRGSHLYDMIVLIHAMAQYSYLARCIGIFGEELKFNKEIERLGEVLTRELDAAGISPETANEDRRRGKKSLLRKIIKEKPVAGRASAHDQFFAYLLYGGYPFQCGVLDRGMMKQAVAECDRIYDGLPLYLKSLGGWDVPLSLVHAVNLLLLGDPRFYETVSRFFEVGGERLMLPSRVNPKTGMGVGGDGDSAAAMAMLFSVLRCMMFMDYEDHLSVFPCPREEWFQPGKEIVVEDAPSRFGPINFRVTSSSNEVLFRFTELPKFNPPEIRFHLPFKAKIKDDSDFIIKKVMGNVYVINGWPSAVRFLKQ